MRARRLITASSFGPKAFGAIGKAFDEAWAEIEPTIGTVPLAVEAARLRLANIVLSLATNDNPNADQIRIEAVKLFDLSI